MIVNKEHITIEINNSMIEFKRIELPPLFLEWQSSGRMAAFEMMQRMNANAVRMMPAHLPVMVTYGEGQFPANLTSRGIGLLPIQDKLDFYSQKIEDTLRAVKDEPWDSSLSQRVAVIRFFYEKMKDFETMMLGGLEIFEGTTFRNLESDPRASLLYTGEAPKFPSYQFNGFIKIIKPGDPYFRFLLAARELFARDSFHIHQIHYPYGYIFYPVELRDKTPFPRR